jgi:hypothetical protein
MILHGLGLEMSDVSELGHKDDYQLTLLEAINLDEEGGQHGPGDEKLAKLQNMSVRG